jgi:ABC-type polysaccharide transport system permease subunit
MRLHHAIVIMSAILAVFGLTLIFFSAPITVADASVVKRASVDISEMQQSIRNLPVEKLHDMTFVFSD